MLDHGIPWLRVVVKRTPLFSTCMSFQYFLELPVPESGCYLLVQKTSKTARALSHEVSCNMFIALATWVKCLVTVRGLGQFKSMAF